MDARYSLYHFARAFHVSTTVPHAYVAERRIDLAKRLLAYSGVPLSTVAATCRFSSQANFSIAFQIATGFSPDRTVRRLLPNDYIAKSRQDLIPRLCAANLRSST
ncbi:helix-turn-helix domain-containing protein [Pararhizobium sp. DWP1-1-3]|uniref:helix-turn-helix domain-containing protein n=1 Tax=Pararhizobium sp. DWP1-1-3 TaxID=2804652 RepID=UPI003CE6ECD7